jgi:hypothetical protein
MKMINLHILYRQTVGSVWFYYAYLITSAVRTQLNQTILASQYKLYLPTEQQLLVEIKKEMEIEGIGYE